MTPRESLLGVHGQESQPLPGAGMTANVHIVRCPDNLSMTCCHLRHVLKISSHPLLLAVTGSASGIETLTSRPRMLLLKPARSAVQQLAHSLLSLRVQPEHLIAGIREMLWEGGGQSVHLAP